MSDLVGNPVDRFLTTRLICVLEGADVGVCGLLKIRMCMPHTVKLDLNNIFKDDCVNTEDLYSLQFGEKNDKHTNLCYFTER